MWEGGDGARVPGRLKVQEANTASQLTVWGAGTAPWPPMSHALAQDPEWD